MVLQEERMNGWQGGVEADTVLLIEQPVARWCWGRNGWQGVLGEERRVV